MYFRYKKILLKVTDGFGCTFLKYMFMFATSPIRNAIVYLVMTRTVLCFTRDSIDNVGPVRAFFFFLNDVTDMFQSKRRLVIRNSKQLSQLYLKLHLIML